MSQMSARDVSYLELPSLHVALAVSAGSDELLPSFSISFSSRSGMPEIKDFHFIDSKIRQGMIA